MRKFGWLCAALLGCAVLYNSQTQQQPAPSTAHTSVVYAALGHSTVTLDPAETEEKDAANPQPVAEPVPLDNERQAGDDQSSKLSNDRHYTNSDGDSVHSPAYSNTVPAGATAQCRDGTYSFSQHHQGTCSHHGGVSGWLP
jgi:hypothetical protein